MSKLILCACLFTLSVSCFASQTAIEACKHTIKSYPQYRDYGPVKAYLSLFTDDAVFNVKQLNISSSGKKQIGQRLIQALKTDNTRHVMGAINIHQHAGAVYMAESDFSLTLTKRLNKKAPEVFITGIYKDELFFDASQCLIKSRDVVIKTKT